MPAGECVCARGWRGEGGEGMGREAEVLEEIRHCVSNFNFFNY